MLKQLGLQWDAEVPLTREINPLQNNARNTAIAISIWNIILIGIILFAIYSYWKDIKTTNSFSKYKTYLPLIGICVVFILFGNFVTYLINVGNKINTDKINTCFEEQNCTFQRMNPCGWMIKRDGVTILRKRNQCLHG